VGDTTGCHDALCGCSTRRANEVRDGDGAAQSTSPAARELFLLALAKHGLGPRDLGPTVSFFKGASVAEDGGLVVQPGSGAGAHVTLRAEQPLIVALVNVPHVLDPRETYTVTPLRVTGWRAAPTAPGDQLWTSSPEAERAFLNTADHIEAQLP